MWEKSDENGRKRLKRRWTDSGNVDLMETGLSGGLCGGGGSNLSHTLTPK